MSLLLQALAAAEKRRSGSADLPAPAQQAATLALRVEEENGTRAELELSAIEPASVPEPAQPAQREVVSAPPVDWLATRPAIKASVLPYWIIAAALLAAAMLAWFAWQYQQLLSTERTPDAALTRPSGNANPDPARIDAAAPLAMPAASIISRRAASGVGSAVTTPPSRSLAPQRGTVLNTTAVFDRHPAAQFIRHADEVAANSPLLLAWQAYQRGDYAAAEAQYRQVLRQTPLQRDALLGLGFIAQQRGLDAEAAAVYRRLLQLNPQDAEATAALSTLQNDQAADAADPTLLGQSYAAKQQWSEAQAQFFAAYNANPQDADAAFNLAVSLDHLAQYAVASDYYRRALALSGGRFIRESVTQRLNELALTLIKAQAAE